MINLTTVVFSEEPTGAIWLGGEDPSRPACNVHLAAKATFCAGFKILLSHCRLQEHWNDGIPEFNACERATRTISGTGVPNGKETVELGP